MSPFAQAVIGTIGAALMAGVGMHLVITAVGDPRATDLPQAQVGRIARRRRIKWPAMIAGVVLVKLAILIGIVLIVPALAGL